MLNKILSFLVCSFLMVCSSEAICRECVILLHGLGRTHQSMTSLAELLKQKNYIIVNETYPSTKQSIENLANQYIPAMLKECQKNHAEHINFVTHSMGGIILRKYLEDHQIANLSRIVMLAPPNHGSKLADLLHNDRLFKFFIGPAGQELTTEKTSVPNTLHHLNPKYQIGIIAGNFSLMPYNYLIFHEENDGKVQVSSTRMSTMKDFIIISTGHTFIMNNLQVQKQILSFLSNGKFIHKKIK